jgi:hypothetical protein
MVQVQIAGFGGEINLAEIVLFMQIIFAGMCIYYFFVEPATNGTGLMSDNIFAVMTDKILGYPECKAVVCLLPSANTLNFYSAALSGNGDATISVETVLAQQFAVFDLIKGMIGFLVAISGLYAFLKFEYAFLYWAVTLV